MEVLAFQIVIFIIIIVAGLASSSARNITVGLIALFTIIMVFSSPLMIIQFATIIIAFIISKSFENEKVENKPISKTNVHSLYRNEHAYPDPSYSNGFLEHYERLEKKIELKKKIERDNYNKLSEEEKQARIEAAYEIMRENMKNLANPNYNNNSDSNWIKRTNLPFEQEQEYLVNLISEMRKDNKKDIL